MSGPRTFHGEAGAVAPDAQARERIQRDLDSTLVVEAAAGTGKTTALVARIVALLASGRATLNSLVAVTFTEKAAGEMKLRLRAEIERARSVSSGEEAARLTRALSELEAARIGTIHSFCADLLRERPVEARVDPHFEVIAGAEEEMLFGEAFERWFQEVLGAPPEGVRRALRRKRRRGRPGPRDELREAAKQLVDHRDFDGRWRREPFDRAAALERVVQRLRALAPLAAQALAKDDPLARLFARVARFVDDLDRREAVRGRDEDGLEAELRELVRERAWAWKGFGALYGVGIERTDAVARKEAAHAELQQVLAQSEADLAACLQRDLWPLCEAYEALKARAGKVDFLDLLVKARDLVRDVPVVRGELQRRFTHLLVDEFQDTDPLQAEILLLLAADDPAQSDWTRVRPVPGKLFVVGDPKQSIYRFRRADVALYETIKRRLCERGATLLHLTQSFRARPTIQQMINAAFAPVMEAAAPSDPAERSQAAYVPLDPYRPDLPEQPAVIALPAPRPIGKYGKVTKTQIEESYPDAVGAFVDWLVNHSGWKVSERESGNSLVPVEPRHVCLLFKRFQSHEKDVPRPYVEALEARRIPHVLVGGRSYHEREEVMALRAALAAIEWPDDELMVFATLRGPFFALPDDALLAWRETVGPLHPFRPVDVAALPPLIAPVAEALGVLAALHRGRNHRPIAETVSRLLAATRAHAGLAVWPAGEQALANVLFVMELARRFEAFGATSFRAFVDRLEDDAERGETGEAPVMEEGALGVRIMTVHKAKGLEFPVVILCDPTATGVPRHPTRHVDPARRVWAMPLAGCAPLDLLDHEAEVLRRDAEEGVRLAYVAATRARDLLVVPVVGVGSIEGSWLSVLDPAVYPKAALRRQPRPAPGAPRFSRRTVLDEDVPDGQVEVAPGLHLPASGPHEVVWWDPSALALDAPPRGGLRQTQILEADDGGSAEAGLAAHAAWQQKRRSALERGAAPSVEVVAATELAAREVPGAAPVTHERTGASREGRPQGKRFGALVHAVLAEVELGAGDASLARVAAAQGRRLGAPEEEVAAAISAVKAALAHPILVRAANSADCRREAPLVVRRPDGTVLEAVVDLAFYEKGAGWTVVDFKTDQDPAERAAVYEAQVRLYVEGIAAATGEPAVGVLLAV